LLVADDRDAPAAERGEAGDDGRIVRVRAVAMHLDPVLHQIVDVVERIRPILMARDQHLLPAREVVVDLGRGFLERRAQPLDLLLLAAPGRKTFELLDLAPELHEWCVEVGISRLHAAGHGSKAGGGGQRGALSPVPSPARAFRPPPRTGEGDSCKGSKRTCLCFWAAAPLSRSGWGVEGTRGRGDGGEGGWAAASVLSRRF